MSGEFFWNTATEARITPESMVDWNNIQKFLTEKTLHFFTFYKKADQLVTAVISHLSGNNSAEDITVALQEVNYDIINVRGLSKKYSTLFCPGKTSDGRLANLITVVGGTFMRMRDLLRPRRCVFLS
jgi:hypothetical protein